MSIPIYVPRKLSDIGVNGRLKKYPDGSYELLVCDRPIFGLDGWEASEKQSKSRSDVASSESIERSVRRARRQIRDYALCSDFDLFVTLTLDKTKIDRYDITVITKRLNNWLDNCVRRKGLRYILVPERHKDGAIHFHGFFNDVLSIVDSGRKDKNKNIIYNLPNWTYGFSTAIRLYGEYCHAVNYVCKYVGKNPEKIGGRWYYSGGSLNSPEVEFVDVSGDCWEHPDGSRFDLPEAKLSFISFKHSAQKG